MTLCLALALNEARMWHCFWRCDNALLKLDRTRPAPLSSEQRKSGCDLMMEILATCCALLVLTGIAVQAGRLWVTAAICAKAQNAQRNMR
ncbi:hypothetical protein JQV27_05785 [Sulfitobacter mediterraneus]|uniref:hypothetical protein n=2 Tax=Sulfitobacter mediterraneus TaxID=83219 RepID=UPI0019329265|nr:hypothetical protein [Sulfitobacter mediterraneus]MBM1640148.1 hypothetical protein [Sulfitobacter mediterraneus]MBM1652288.1 hypothetical protein [Sulfitobacter mediterraneus]MBM1656336.1 hypothetical protein [Sulfitobacter mediterraneus]MBM1664427.1 hypothetical protein [Sulfitobacter mediterraneus]MBM1672519.1 hypothetical protein [Sulfitobacter mediterraneus]